LEKDFATVLGEAPMSIHTEIGSPTGSFPPPEEPAQRAILRGVNWETYERLLAGFADSHAVHFTYDRGVLEIMVLSFKHETINRTLATLVATLAEELEIDLVSAGSTTFKREDFARGFEPDSCFYIQQAARVRGKEKIDLTTDPPPDLVIEIDLTHPSLNKFPIYTHIGVPEVWRYDGSQVHMLRLDNGEYNETEYSLALPLLTAEIATQFVEASTELSSPAWLRRVRTWVQQHRAT
jgi:Uma2 family endonuclease